MKLREEINLVETDNMEIFSEEPDGVGSPFNRFHCQDHKRR